MCLRSFWQKAWPYERAAESMAHLTEHFSKQVREHREWAPATFTVTQGSSRDSVKSCR